MKMNVFITMLGICLVLYPTQVIGSEQSIEPLCTSNIQSIVSSIDMVQYIDIPEPEPTIEVKKLNNDEVDLISRVVMAEAEDEPMEGKIYVIDTILNRVDSKHFPNNVHDVIYQPSQFTSMWNGRYNRCRSNKELNDIINEEYQNRKNSNIVFFTADRYGENGKPSFRVANHYFSVY